MMRFEKTTNYSIPKRIEIVSKEILLEYPMIHPDDAVEIASACCFVPDNITQDDVFRRYYYILNSIYMNYNKANIVYNDMLKYCSEGLEDSVNIELFNDLAAYFNGELESFPIISKYYE